MTVFLVILNYSLFALNVYFWVKNRSALSAAAAAFSFGAAQLLTAFLVVELFQQ